MSQVEKKEKKEEEKKRRKGRYMQYMHAIVADGFHAPIRPTHRVRWKTDRLALWWFLISAAITNHHYRRGWHGWIERIHETHGTGTGGG